MGGAFGPRYNFSPYTNYFLSPPPDARSSPFSVCTTAFQWQGYILYRQTMPKKFAYIHCRKKICSGLLRSYIAVYPIRIVEFYKLNTV